MSKSAKRFNKDKIELSRVPADAIAEEAKVWMYGERKYPRENPNGPANWEALWGDDTIQVALDSGLRHMAAMCNREMFDRESGLLHASHVRANMAFIIRQLANHGMITPSVYTGNPPPPPKDSSKSAEEAEDSSYHIGGCV